MTTWILAGLGLIGGGIAMRRMGPALQKHWPAAQQTVKGMLGEHRYKDGFQTDMDRYEAGKILGKFWIQL